MGRKSHVVGVQEVKAAHDVQCNAVTLLVPAQLGVSSQRRAQIATCDRELPCRYLDSQDDSCMWFPVLESMLLTKRYRKKQTVAAFSFGCAADAAALLQKTAAAQDRSWQERRGTFHVLADEHGVAARLQAGAIELHDVAVVVEALQDAHLLQGTPGCGAFASSEEGQILCAIGPPNALLFSSCRSCFGGNAHGLRDSKHEVIDCTALRKTQGRCKEDRASVNLSMLLSSRTRICLTATSCTPPRIALYTCRGTCERGFV